MAFNPDNFNWGDHASDGEVRLLPPGDYVGDVKSFKRTRDRGKHQLDLTIEILASCDTREAIDSVCWETLTISPEAIWRLADLCKAVDAPTTFNLNSDGEIANAIKQKLMVISLRVDEWNGKKRNKVDRYRKLSTEEDQLAETLKLYGDDSGGNGGPDPDSGGGGGGGDFTDDDIPF
jgi:Protein of unknown function (DUF669)